VYGSTVKKTCHCGTESSSAFPQSRVSKMLENQTIAGQARNDSVEASEVPQGTTVA